MTVRRYAFVLLLMTVALAPFALSQTGADHTDRSDVAKTEPTWQKAEPKRTDPGAPGDESCGGLELRVQPLDGGALRIDVVQVGGGVGDLMIVICTIGPGGLTPVGILDGSDAAQRTFAVPVHVLARLELAMFAVRIAPGDLQIGDVYTARQLADEAPSWR